MLLFMYAGQYDPSLPGDTPNRQAGNLSSVTESNYFKKYSLRSWSLKRRTVSGTAKTEGTIVQNIKHVTKAVVLSHRFHQQELF